MWQLTALSDAITSRFGHICLFLPKLQRYALKIKLIGDLGVVGILLFQSIWKWMFPNW